jgi:hypothetical protein
VPGPGRNQPCPCGSHRKTKHCCGQQRGPAAEQLARAHVATLCQQAIPDLATLSDNALNILWEELIDLPGIDYSLLVTLPTLISPDLQRLRQSVHDDDPDGGWDTLTTVATEIDTPQQRARLANAIISLRDQRRISRRQAAYALLDLNTPSTRLIGAILLKAIAVSIGAHPTPNGLQIAA